MDESLRESRHYPKEQDINPSPEDRHRADIAWDQLHEMAVNPEHPDWNKLLTDGDVSVYSRTSRFPHGPTEFRIDGVIDAPLKQALNILKQSIIRTKWDKTLRVFDEVCNRLTSFL